MSRVVVSGKRKTAVARVSVTNDHAHVVLYNGKPAETLSTMHKLLLAEPIRIYQHITNKQPGAIHITTRGGGKESQIHAARLGIGKALLKLSGNTELRKAYMAYDRQLLVADTRRKEAYKPGDSKARRKRQKSYR